MEEGRPERLWTWEGSVQVTVVMWLRQNGWTITRAADTASRERGKDIEAELGSHRLWVTVKGFPAGTPRTRPGVQARHWFSHAMFDVISYREEDRDVRLAVALPDVPRYRSMAERTTWFQEAASFAFVWVGEDGYCRAIGGEDLVSLLT